MANIHDYDIHLIEEEILAKYNSHQYDYTNFSCLLSLRKSMINERVLENQVHILSDIIAFNDALTIALKEMYDKAHHIWNNLKEELAYGNDVELIAKCFLSSDYPKLHPIQDEKQEELWRALCDSGWNPLYGYGITLLTYSLPSKIDEPFDTLIGMDCNSNWNEGLDFKLTKDLHLSSAFHNIFAHMNFAITDFVYVRKFDIEINIVINSK